VATISQGKRNTGIKKQPLLVCVLPSNYDTEILNEPGAMLDINQAL